MSLDQSDLRELLFERAAQLPQQPNRLEQVRGRIERVRRRRRVTSIAASVVAVVAIATVSVALLNRSATVTTVVTPDGAPAYYAGGKLIAHASIDSPKQDTVSTTFVPANWQLALRIDCSSTASWSTDVAATVSVNGHLIVAGGCGTGMTNAGPGQDEDFWSAVGVRLGDPSTVTLAFTATLLGSDGPLAASPLPVAKLPSAVVSLGVYQRVPLAAYRFPKAPKTLARVMTPPGNPTLESSKVGPNGRWTLDTRAKKDAQIQVNAVAPGALSFAVEGKLVGLCEIWDYADNSCGVDLDAAALSGYGVDVTDGQRIQVVVEASRFARHAWALAVNAN